MEEALKQDNINTLSQEPADATNDSILTTFNENNDNQIQAFVSEDFITQAQGKFESSQNVSAQAFDTQFGSFSSDEFGNWQYKLNNQLAEVQSLSAGDAINEFINLFHGTISNYFSNRSPINIHTRKA